MTKRSSILANIAAVVTAMLTIQVLAKKTPPLPPERYLPAPPATPFAIGDLVAIEGYEGRLYYIDCYTEARQTDDVGTIFETHYDLTCAGTGEYEIAFAEDLTLVARAADAEAYLDSIDYMPAIQPLDDEIHFPKGAFPMQKQFPKSQRELSAIEATQRQQARQRKQALTDRLLDQRKQYSDLAAFFGGGYDGNIAQIDEDLTKLAMLELPTAGFLNEVEKRIEQRVAHRTYDAPLKPEVSE